MSFENIPDDLKSFNQFVVWKVEYRDGKATKVPYDAKTGLRAAVDNPATWSDFHTALQVAQKGEVAGIGFVLTEGDPFGFIDLDDAWKKHVDGSNVHEDPDAEFALQQQIETTFDSYTEKSPSGEGLHIIVRTPGVAKGRKRSSVEVYTSKHFMTMTGNVFRNAPVAERGDLVHILWGQMGEGRDQRADVGVDSPQVQSDDAMYDVASKATNGATFVALWQGRWRELGCYPSQSEADFALIDILAFYTQNREQVTRMFRASALGIRDKAKRDDYVTPMVAKAMPTMAALNFDHLFKQATTEGGGGLPIVMASEFHGKPVPMRMWLVDQLIPARTVTYFGGNGGDGKSQAALQLTVSTVLGRAWFGVPIRQPGGALFLTAEDDLDEVHRRLAAIAKAEGVPLSKLDKLAISSLAGLDALMAVPGHGRRVLTPTAVYAALRAFVKKHRPAVVVLDTLANLFGGDEVNRAQVRQFVTMLTAIAIEDETTVVLLAHPSVAGMKDNSGLSGSTAWNNSVRSRLYIRRENEFSDVRIIEVKKANYGETGKQIRVKWEGGLFVLQGGVGTASEHKRSAEAEIDALFLELLGEFEARRMVVSPQWQSRSRYVAKLMGDHPKANGVTVTAFYDAMVRLIASGRIEERVERIDRRDTRIIATVPS